ncbi:MAG: hypothetical protein IJU86_01405 [Firmicutes bacterium]|nr:hypothetical protein [Bacillota bacterium]
MTKKNKKQNINIYSKREFITNEKEKIFVDDIKQNFLNNKPSWRFTYSDLTSEYSILDCKNSLFTKLKNFESMTFKEIFIDGYHFHHKISNLDKMLKFVKERLKQLGLNENLEIYSLRLDSTTRIYGFIESNIFYILWYDPKHELYPVAKKHT